VPGIGAGHLFGEGAGALEYVRREQSARGGADIAAFPEIRRFQHERAVFVAYPDAARNLPRGAEPLVGISEAAANPALACLLDIKVHRTALRTRVAEKNIVVFDIDLTRSAPLVEEAGAFQYRVFVPMRFIVLRDDAVALEV